MPYLSIWIHLVWGTKYRRPSLSPQLRAQLFPHLHQNAEQKGIYLKTVGGYVDHVHCLIALKGDQSIARVVNLLKGESAFWINRNKLTPTKFAWADGYYAASVGKEGLGNVIRYIQNQEAHHQNPTLQGPGPGSWSESESDSG